MTTTATKIMYSETGHRLTDYAHGKCQHLHGHSYRWEVSAEMESGGVDYRGMVIDFSDLKDAMKEVIEPLDHAMVFHNEDPLVVLHGDALGKLLVSTADNPPRLFVFPWNPTAENLAAHVGNSIAALLPDGINITRVRVFETVNSYVDWLPEVRGEK